MTPAPLGLRAGGRFFRFWDNRCIPEAKLHPVLEHLLTSNFFEVNQLNFAEIVCFSNGKNWEIDVKPPTHILIPLKVTVAQKASK